MNHQLFSVILDSQESIHQLVLPHYDYVLNSNIACVMPASNYLLDMTLSPTRLLLELLEDRNRVFPCSELSDLHTTQGITGTQSIFVDLNNCVVERVNW